MRLQVVGFVSVIVLSSVGYDVMRAQATISGTADRISFTSARPANWDVYLLDGAGRPPRRLTSDPGLDYGPALSPDGRWLVFCSERDGDPDLYVLDLASGGDPSLLIDSDSMEDQATFAPDGRSIAFVSTHSGNADVYQLPFRPDRTQSMADAENLTRHPRADLRPAFAPDGRQIAFSSDRDSPINLLGPIGRIRDGDIYVMDLGSRQTRRLTNAPGWDGSPAWSSDGRVIAFYSQRETASANRLAVRGVESWSRPQARIWTVQADGSNARLVTPDETLALSPEFMSGGRIVYSRKTKDGLWQIVSVAVDGSDVRIEGDSSKRSYWKPATSRSKNVIAVHGSESPGVPDGERMSFRFTFSNGPFLTTGAPFRRTLPDRSVDLFPIRAFTAILHPRRDLVLNTTPNAPELQATSINGGDRRPFFRYLAVNGGPNFRNPGDAFRWSKDGEWILVAQGDSSFNATTQGDIWKIKADGTGLQNLTPDSPGNDTHPSFSRDGREIVFRSSRSGSFELYVMNSDGSNVRRLTNDAANDLFPVFSPSARQVAFMSNRDAQQPHVYDVYLLDLLDDGQPGRVRRLTRVDAQKGHMAYSYDGRWLIYSSEEGGSMTRSRSCNPSFLRDRATARCTPSTSAMDAWCA